MDGTGRPSGTSSTRSFRSDLCVAGLVPLLRVLGTVTGADDDFDRNLRTHRWTAPGGHPVLPLRVHSDLIFASLDLFLYYAFWELSLVPMTILIATYGRTDGRHRAAIRYFLYAFIPI